MCDINLIIGGKVKLVTQKQIDLCIKEIAVQKDLKKTAFIKPVAYICEGYIKGMRQALIHIGLTNDEIDKQINELMTENQEG